MRLSGKPILTLIAAAAAIALIIALTLLWGVRETLEKDISLPTEKEIVHSEYIDSVAPAPVHIILVGDIMLSRQVGAVMKSMKDYRYPFLEVADVLREADITFGNLEGPVSSLGTDLGSVYSFRADPMAVEGLSFAGFDVVSLANNHILDWGREALLDTISRLSSAGIKSVGAGAEERSADSPAIFDVRGTKVGFLAYTTLYPKSLEAGADNAGVSNIDKAAEEVKRLREDADIIVVSVHWGEEYELFSDEAQRELAHRFVEAGADIVVGHHPHVAEEVERYKNSWIFYSLGNFVFDQTFSEETRTGLVIEVIADKKGVLEISTQHVYISKTFQPTFVDL